MVLNSFKKPASSSTTRIFSISGVNSLREGGLGFGQSENEFQAVRLPIVELHASRYKFGGLQTNRQSQTSPEGPRREERFEDLRNDLGRNSGTVIGDDDFQNAFLCHSADGYSRGRLFRHSINGIPQPV